MNTAILETLINSAPGPWQKKDISIIINETGKLAPRIITVAKRFGVSDLWNIRRKGRDSHIRG